MPPQPPPRDDDSANREEKRLFRQQDRQEEAAVRRLLSLVKEARKEVRESILRFDAAGSFQANVFRQMEASLTDVLARTQISLTSTLRSAVADALELGIQVAEVRLPPLLRLLPFRLPESLVTALNTYHASLIQDVTDGLRGQVTRQVQLALLSGKPTPELIREIGATGIQPTGPFLTATERAEAIARTELNRVPNLATGERLKAAGERIPGLQKEWIATRDSRTRPTHRAAGGQRVGIDEKFLVGGHKADHPLDPALPASESVRCRCRMVAIVPDE